VDKPIEDSSSNKFLKKDKKSTFKGPNIFWEVSIEQRKNFVNLATPLFEAGASASRCGKVFF
jgi:hypothetical protein